MLAFYVRYLCFTLVNFSKYLTVNLCRIDILPGEVDLTRVVQVALLGVDPCQPLGGVHASCEVVEVPLDPIGYLEPLVGVVVVVNAATDLASLLSVKLKKKRYN